MPRPARDRLLLVILAILGIVLLRTAWTCDDAFITFRTLDNFLNGHGMRWNTVERVQVFTHPLWWMALVVPTAITHEAYLTSMIVSIAVSLSSCWLLASRVVPRGLSGAAIVTLLGLSSAFIDYSTSGLENPLTFLLIAVFLAMCPHDAVAPRRLVALSFVACLLVLNRLDLIVLIAPSLAYAVMTAARPVPWGRIAAAWLPLVSWEVFAFLYFGSPVPNTAFAKLGSGHDAVALTSRGLDYLLQSARFDPVLATVLVAGVVLSLRPSTPMRASLAVGIVAYVGYVVRAGGDFMIGRMLTGPFVVAAVLVVTSLPRRAVWIMSLGAGLAAVGGVGGRVPSCVTGPDFGQLESRAWGRHGVTDERHAYYPGTGLLSSTREGLGPSHPWADEGRRLDAKGARVEVALTVGMLGYYAGPDVHIIDRGALCDPLLARLPARFTPDWRVGHYWRMLPDGYAEHALDASPRVDDPGLQQLADAVFKAARAPVLSPDRLRAVWRLATASLVDRPALEAYRLPGIRQATLRRAPDGGLRWIHEDGLDVTGVGIELSSDEPFTIAQVDVVSSSCDWRAAEVGSASWRREVELTPVRDVESRDGRSCRLHLPGSAHGRSVSHVRLFPTIDLRPGDRSPRQVVTSVRIVP